MSQSLTYKRWFLTEDDLRDMDPLKARDLIVKCFAEAQKETFQRAREHMGVQADDEQLLQNLRSAVKVTFKDVGGDFFAPTKDTLERVVESLASKSKSFGTPEDVIEHHREQIESVLALL